MISFGVQYSSEVMELRRIEFNSQSVKVNPAAAVLFFTFWKDQVTPVLSFSRRVRERLLIIIHSVPYIARSQLSFEKYHKVIRSSRRSRRRRIELKEHCTHKKYYKAREIKIIIKKHARALLFHFIWTSCWFSFSLSLSLCLLQEWWQLIRYLSLLYRLEIN